MVQETGSSQPDLENVIETAVADDTIPTFYANGFVNSVTSADVLMLLQRSGRIVAKVNMSFTIAKTMVQKLGRSIAEFEQDVGSTIPTTDDVMAAIAKKRGGHDAVGE